MLAKQFDANLSELIASFAESISIFYILSWLVVNVVFDPFRVGGKKILQYSAVDKNNCKNVGVGNL